MVIANLSERETLYVGTVRLLSGPTTILVDEEEKAASSGEPQRLVGPYLRQPSLDTQFQPTRFAESGEVQWLEDWVYFEQGIDRLIEHVRSTGLNTLIVTVAANGGAWYPSEVLAPGAQWDKGRYSELGRDPLAQGSRWSCC
ncbi:MAG: hypothetical protein R3B96_07205 [Pirellulaceae bacterium]